MPNTQTETLPGIGGGTITVPIPSDTALGAIFTEYEPPGQSLIEAIAAAMAGGTLVPLAFTGAALPTLPAGASGYLIDTIGGAVTLSAAYATAVATGANPVTIEAAAGHNQSVIAGAGPLRFSATEGSGTLLSASGGSTIALGAAQYTVSGSGGSDTLFAAGGSGSYSFLDDDNLVVLGDGNFSFESEGEGDTIATGAGTYSVGDNGGSDIFLGPGTATVNGPFPVILPSGIRSADGEIVANSSGDTTVNAYQGMGLLVTNGSGNIFVNQTLNEFASPANGANSFFGGAGSLTVTAGGGPENTLVVGGSAGHNLIDTALGGTVFGGGDGDVLLGPASGVIAAGPGAETISGQSGLSGARIFGGSGPDLIFGGASDTVVAGTGATTISTEASAFGLGLVALGTGPDDVFLNGDLRAATVAGEPYLTDVLFAGAGPATVNVATYGLIVGGSGAMQVFMGSAATTFTGGSGAATIMAGAGTDLLRYINSEAGGADLVMGFDPMEDSIVLQGYGADAVAATLGDATVAGGSTTIALSDGTRVVFAGVTSLTAADFLAS